MLFVRCSICGEFCVNPVVLELHRLSAHRGANCERLIIGKAHNKTKFN